MYDREFFVQLFKAAAAEFADSAAFEGNAIPADRYINGCEDLARQIESDGEGGLVVPGAEKLRAHYSEGEIKSFALGFALGNTAAWARSIKYFEFVKPSQ